MTQVESIVLHQKPVIPQVQCQATIVVSFSPTTITDSVKLSKGSRYAHRCRAVLPTAVVMWPLKGSNVLPAP